jgi:aromatic ring hydroxylase
MIRTAEVYREGLRDGREVWMDNERVADVTKHPVFRPIIDVKARMYDMAYEPAAFARDLLNSDYAGHRLTFVQFVQAPHFNHLAAVYNSFDFDGPLDFVRRAASLSEKVTIPPS